MMHGQTKIKFVMKCYYTKQPELGLQFCYPVKSSLPWY